MSTKEKGNDRSQSSKVGKSESNKIMDKIDHDNSKSVSDSQKRDLKDKQNKGNGKEKVDRKTVLSNLNKDK